MVHINIRGTGRVCGPPISRCTSHAELAVYTGNVAGTRKHGDYRNTSTVPTNRIPNPQNPNKFYSFDDVYSVNVLNQRFLRVLFRTTYFCGTIKHVEVYYYTCPSVSKQLKFPVQMAPDKQVCQTSYLILPLRRSDIASMQKCIG